MKDNQVQDILQWKNSEKSYIYHKCYEPTSYSIINEAQEVFAKIDISW